MSRIVEIEYDDEEGFTPRVEDPKALRVCKESRIAIIQSYPLCFGSIFHPAKTRFNFAIDTLYLGNEIEDQVPHFFSTFGKPEISGLQFLALENCYNEATLPFEVTMTSQLQTMVKKLTSLRELLIVFDVADMTDRGLNCVEGHTMELHDKLPEELLHPAVLIDPLPTVTDEEGDDFKIWKVQKCRPVYGWRKCPHGEPFDGRDLEDEMMSDDENWDRFGYAWGPFGGPPMAMPSSRLFHRGDSDDEDDMFGYGDDLEDAEDDEDDEDVNINPSDAISVESVD